MSFQIQLQSASNISKLGQEYENIVVGCWHVLNLHRSIVNLLAFPFAGRE